MKFTRRTLLSLLPAALHAQLPARVNYRHYSQGLPAYLTKLAAQARERREVEMAKLTAPQAIAARQKWARTTFWQLNGGEPERTPLNQRTVGTFERDGYRVDKIIYESRPGLVVSANLYIPSTGSAAYPGVLFQMGHTANGKAAIPYQKCCQGLARLGYVVLAFDPFGQGERIQYGSKVSPTGHHSMAGKQMLLVGDTASKALVWDAVRSLDLLASLPIVDPKRLASTGQSGGGLATQLLSCVDTRLAAAVVCSGNTENFACADFIPPGSADDGEQDLMDSGAVGFDRWDMLYPLAPKPLLVMVSARDFFGTYSPNYLDDGRAEFARLAAVYQRLGYKDRIAWKETPLAHSLSHGLRVETYNWFERWLKNSTRKITDEPPVSPEKDETLWCGATGNVVRDFQAKSPVVYSRERVRSAPVPVAQLLKLEPVSRRLSVLARVPSEGVDVEALEVESDADMFLPAWFYLPKRESPSATILLALDARGRNPGAGEDGLYSRLAAAGLRVCAADLRGNGDAVPQFGRGNPGYERSRNEEESYAWASVILGRPLVTQRVADILAWVAALSLRGRIVVAASGKMTVPALLAAAIDKRIESLFLAGGLRSFRDVIDDEESNVPLSELLPSVLLHTDLPEIAAGLSPRKVEMRGEGGWKSEALLAFARS